MNGSLERVTHGHMPDGTQVDHFTLRNPRGMEARISTYGGNVTHLFAADRNGHRTDVLLGHDSLQAYLDDATFYSCLLGRFANRIARSQFVLEGREYVLAANDGRNALHGGVRGFDKVVWTVATAGVSRDGPVVKLLYQSRDGEEGYPGNLTATAEYVLRRDDSLQLVLTATTDRTTVVNLSTHFHFNLAGEGDVLEHMLQLHGSRYTPVNHELLPTGELRAVEGGCFDFRQPRSIAAGLAHPDDQVLLAGGYDHNWVIDKPTGEFGPMARVYDPRSGRVLEILSTSPGLQCYSGNFLDGSVTGKAERRHAFRSGLCLEPQYFPDSPNQPAFPSTVLVPGGIHRNEVLFRFSAR